MTVTIDLGARTAFEPGAEIIVPIEWDLPSAPRSLELTLRWMTRGKGTTDTETVKVLPVSFPEASGRRDLNLTLPDRPYSFTGRLVSLTWTLELMAQGPHESARVDIVIAPERREIVITPLASTSS